MVAFNTMRLLHGEAEFVKVPTDSGRTHWVARCPQCYTAMWNEHGSRRAVTRYVRVGTFDEPARFAPRAHIYVRSKQPWLQLNDPAAPSFKAYYNASTTWPEESLQRYAQAKAAREAEAASKPARR
jgi:hypothetical protein